VSTVGIRAALIATGVFLPALGVLFWRRLTAIDRAARIPLHEIALLRQIPIFAPLAPPRLEELAARLRPQEVAAGSEVFRQGDPGDRFYVIDAGEVEVRMDGSLVRKQGPGDYFGEIALLHDSPRTATVVAATPLRLYGLEREEFIGAVTGHTDSRAAAETVAGARLATAKPPGFVLE
jgi:CRP-like cAMP-binding protein